MAVSETAPTIPVGDQATPGPGAPKGWGLPLLVLIVGMFMSVLDVTIVNVAIPSIQRDLGATAQDALWIATAYTLTLGVVVPLSSWLGDRFGLTRVYIAALLGFASCSVLCGLAWDLNSLIAFRVLQAIPGGVLPVVTMTMVYRIVPREKIGAAMGMYGMGIVFAPAIGPVLGGYLVEYQNWRWIFFVNAPVGLVGAVAALVVLTKIGPSVRRPFDVLGFSTIGFGLFAILLACSKGEDWGWTSYPTLIWLVAGALSLALFVVVELEVEYPLLDVRMFRYTTFTTSLLLLSILTLGLFAALYYVPVFLQQGQGLTAFTAGLRILPQALVVGVLMPIVGRLYDRIGPRWLVTSGFLVSAVGTYLLAGINPDVTSGEIVLWTCVRNAGMGLAMMPIMTAGIASLPPSKVNQGSTLNNVARQVSGALGLAVLTALASSWQAQQLADRSALLTRSDMASRAGGAGNPGGLSFTEMYQLMLRTRVAVLADSYSDLFLIVAAVMVIGALLALRLRSGRPAAAQPPLPPAPSAKPAAGEPTVGLQPVAQAVSGSNEPQPEPVADPTPAAPNPGRLARVR